MYFYRSAVNKSCSLISAHLRVLTVVFGQWRRLHTARGHVLPIVQTAGHGGTVSK